MYYSRLARKQERLSRRQTYLFLAGSIVLLILIAAFGFSVLFNLANTISSIRNNKSTETSNSRLAPSIPRLSEDLEATNSANLKIAGFGDAKTSIELFQNNQSDQTAVTDSQGQFSFDVSLNPGNNIFQVQAISDSGQKSQKSEPYTVTYLSTRPNLELISPKDNDTVKDNPLNLTGQTDAGVSISVNDHLVLVDSAGKFNLSINLQNGDNKLKIIATDKAGNQSTLEITVKYSP